MRNNDKEEVSRIINDYTKRIDQLTERVNALSIKHLVHRRLPLSPNSLNTNFHRYQVNTGYINKIKIEIPKYDVLDGKKVIMWFNKIEGIFL